MFVILNLSDLKKLSNPTQKQNTAAIQNKKPKNCEVTEPLPLHYHHECSLITIKPSWMISRVRMA
jgi:hypothetical protein